MTKKETPIDHKELRKQLGMSQSEYWNRLGVEQSSGSRYESGHCIPKPVQKLAILAYRHNINIPEVRQ